MNQIREFKKFFASRKPKAISFLSENQDYYDVADPCALQLSFTNMLISENPDVIYLTGHGCTMRLDRVKSVEYSCDATPLGILIKVFCENPAACPGKFSYTLIAS